MKRFGLIGPVLVVPILFLAASKSDDPKPQYTSDGHLLAPGDFREWIFLSSGLGMNYNAQAGGHVIFTNVFVPQWAYHEFLKSGKWPDKTMFVVEDRDRKSTRLNSSHMSISYAVFCLKKKKKHNTERPNIYPLTILTRSLRAHTVTCALTTNCTASLVFSSMYIIQCPVSSSCLSIVTV